LTASHLGECPATPLVNSQHNTPKPSSSLPTPLLTTHWDEAERERRIDGDKGQNNNMPEHPFICEW